MDTLWNLVNSASSDYEQRGADWKFVWMRSISGDGETLLFCVSNWSLTWCLTSSLARSQASVAPTLPSNSAQVRRRDEQEDTQWSKPAQGGNHTRHEMILALCPGLIQLSVTRSHPACSTDMLHWREAGQRPGNESRIVTELKLCLNTLFCKGMSVWWC